MVSVSELAMAAPRLEVQLCLLLMQASFWLFFIPYFGLKLVKPWIDPKPWRSQFASLSQKTLKNSFFVDVDVDTAYDFACVLIGIIVQHGIGGALCIPALLPSLGVPRNIAAALACHGGLCEAGWELQDSIYRIYEVLFTRDGRKRNPNELLVVLFIHHTLGLSMVIPMNLAYHDLYWYHEGVFLLQFAAFAALMAQNYGYTLDIGTVSGLRQMKLTVTFVMACMAWSRGVRYAYVAYMIVAHLRAVGDQRMLAGAAVGIGAMSLFNMLFLGDATSKFVKFISMKSPKNEMERKMVRSMSEDFLSALHDVRHPSSFELSKAKRSWARLRGAQRMGALRRPTPSEDKVD